MTEFDKNSKSIDLEQLIGEPSGSGDHDAQNQIDPIITQQIIQDITTALSPREFFIELFIHPVEALNGQGELLRLTIGNMIYDVTLFYATTEQEMLNKAALLKAYLTQAPLNDDPNILLSICQSLEKIATDDHLEVHLLASDISYHINYVDDILQGKIT